MRQRRLWLFAGLTGAFFLVIFVFFKEQGARMPPQGRDTPHFVLKIVGSETVYPYAAVVAETFAAEENQPIPVIESVGTGAGVQLFCRGPGRETASLLMASRPLSAQDIAHCQKNGVPAADIAQISIGFESLVFVQSLESPPLDLTPQQLFQALSASIHPAPQLWRDIGPHLPATPIKILGPARVAGTYDSLVSLVLEPFCTPERGPDCLKIRPDGRYMEMSSNQNLIIAKIIQNPKQSPACIGIVPFAFFEQNKHRLRAISLNGIAPSFDNATQGRYPFLRPLYLYVKKSHLRFFPKLATYVRGFFKPQATHKWAPLTRKGLIPCPVPPLMPDLPEEGLDSLKRLGPSYAS